MLWSERPGYKSQLSALLVNCMPSGAFLNLLRLGFLLGKMGGIKTAGRFIFGNVGEAPSPHGHSRSSLGSDPSGQWPGRLLKGSVSVLGGSSSLAVEVRHE